MQPVNKKVKQAKVQLNNLKVAAYSIHQPAQNIYKLWN